MDTRDRTPRRMDAFRFKRPVECVTPTLENLSGGEFV